MQPDYVASKDAILVVDDNAESRLVVESHLSAAGYQVVQAENGKQALEVFAAHPVNLVLLDVLMPIMDGFEACRRLRAMDRGSDVPILFVTALGDLLTHERALDSGADDLLAKPIQRVELLLRTKSLLRIKRFENELARSNQLIGSQCDALLRAQEQKRRLTAMIVHDLRGPLACVLGNAEYLLDGPCLTECYQAALRDIHNTAGVMHRMVNDLLDVARSEDGALIPKYEPLDVPDLLDDVRCYLRGRERKARHQIIIEGAPAAGPIQADKDLIRRVVENLVENSMKYAPEGTDIRLEVSAMDGDRILFRVRDHGPGVPLEHRDKIFDQYVHFENGRCDHTRASRGLGLAFCRLAIEAHGGRIWVEDNSPAGSAFCFWIPTANERHPKLSVARTGLGTVEKRGAASCTPLRSLAAS